MRRKVQEGQSGRPAGLVGRLAHGIVWAMRCGTFTAHGPHCSKCSRLISLIGPISPISLPAVSALRNSNAHGESIAHGTWGETLLFPPWPPFSPVCYMGACGTQCTFFKLPRSPRRLRQRGGLNARCHSASQNIFCDVAAFAAIPSLGPCALGTHGLAPCVRVAQECSTRY